MATGKAEVDVFQDGADLEHSGEHEEHPEWVDEDKKNDEKPQVILVQQEFFDGGRVGGVRGDVNGFDDKCEKEHEGHDQDDLKEQDIEVPDEPLIGPVVPLTNLVHEVSEAHKK